jgi:exodeoxyribonuclease V alpha subunit
MTPAELLATLEAWRNAGWLRSLDLAIARFIHELDPGAPASLLLAAALTAQLEGRGHSALPLAELAADAEALLGWPGAGVAALRQTWAQTWAQAHPTGPGPGPAVPLPWRARAVLDVDPADDQGASPLVFSRGLMYLRRYWRYETRVAAQIGARTTAVASVASVASVGLDPGASGTLSAPGAPGALGALGALGAATRIDPLAARALLDSLFGPTDPAAGTDWQKVACAVALRGRLSIVTGGPGTGKTYTAARLLVLLQALHAGPQPLRVVLAAPTGKAAARLRQSIQDALQGLRQQPGAAAMLGDWAERLAPARTLHSLLGTQPGTRRFRHDAANPLDLDLLFVDEASMVHLEMMAQLLEALPAGARVVLLGDKDQLASVEAGAVLGDLCQGAADGGAAGGYVPETAAWIGAASGQALPPSALGAGPALAQQTVVLRHSRRFDGPIGQLALALNGGDAATAIAMLQADPDGPVALRRVAESAALLPLAVDGRAGAAGGYGAYLQQLARRPADAAAFADWARSVLRHFDGFRVLCALREGPWGVAGLNGAIERALVAAGRLVRQGDWYEGRPVMVTRNDAALGVFNGDVGIVLRAPGADAALRCYFLDADELRSVAVGRLADVETAFAMTVHKSQGSEFAHVLLVLPDEDVPVLTRELVYTGITRASQAFTLGCRNTDQLAVAAARLTRRVSGLRALMR